MYCYLPVEIMPTYTYLFPVLPTMAAVICMGGATLLFLRGRNNRSRRILAFIMSAGGLIYVVRVVGMLLVDPGFNFIRANVVDTFVLVIGNLYLIILLLYPLEVVRPGCLNLKRTSILLLPYVSITLLYYIVLFFLGQKPLALSDMNHGTHRGVQCLVPPCDDPRHCCISRISTPIDMALSKILPAVVPQQLLR